MLTVESNHEERIFARHYLTTGLYKLLKAARFQGVLRVDT